jgi:hypothetical protein
MVDAPPVDEPAAWTLLADALLQRAALVARVAFDRQPSPLAGLRVDDDDVVRLLAELPGAARGDDEAVAEILDLTEPAIADARKRLDDDEWFSSLAIAAGLDGDEAEILAVLAAVDLDPRRQRLAGFLNDDVTVRHLTPFSLAQLFADEPGRVAAVAPGGGLQRAALLEPVTERPWSRAPLRLSAFVGWRLTGYDGDDPELPIGCEAVELPVQRAGAGFGVVIVAGTDRVRRLQAAAHALGVPRLLVSPIPATPESWGALIRQASLDGDAVVLEASDELEPDARARVDAATHLSFAICSTVDLPITSLPRRPWVGVTPAEPAATREEVAAVLGEEVAQHAATLTAEQLEAVGIAAAGLGGDADAAIRRLAAGHIDRMANRITPRHSWDDLVLRSDRLDLVREVGIRYRHRRQVYEDWGFGSRASTGVIAMFSGESGTGKTLSAEIIAGELGQDLYTIDLAQLVSKYIGETEKNLSAVFSAAEASPVVLFFDEADALIGKRSAVSDAHDRYANIEVAYLLQRMERHNGIVVLATNMASNIDKAFARRIHVAVDFPMPQFEERLRIWRRSLPDATPLEGVRLEPFAERFEMSGGSIRNAALTAGFLAADSGTGITPEHLVEAVTREMRKLGRWVREDDFAGL